MWFPTGGALADNLTLLPPGKRWLWKALLCSGAFQPSDLNREGVELDESEVSLRSVVVAVVVLVVVYWMYSLAPIFFPFFFLFFSFFYFLSFLLFFSFFPFFHFVYLIICYFVLLLFLGRFSSFL